MTIWAEFCDRQARQKAPDDRFEPKPTGCSKLRERQLSCAMFFGYVVWFLVVGPVNVVIVSPDFFNRKFWKAIFTAISTYQAQRFQKE